MDLHQLRCFVATAEELHFGLAARRLQMLPSALGRHIRLLEEDLETQLFLRTTRNVALTGDGVALLDEAKDLIAKADAIVAQFKARGRTQAHTLRVGAIDSAAAGLIPPLLRDFKLQHPDIAVQLLEEKTIKLLPRLLSGRLDIAFVRPPENVDQRLEFMLLFHETAVVALSEGHALAGRTSLSIRDIADETVIVPDRRSRPHSHDLTIKLFADAGLHAKTAQLADEKQTIVNLVAADLGVAIVPRWTSRLAISGVKYLPLKVEGPHIRRLPLAAAWVRGSRDPSRNAMLQTLRDGLAVYSENA